MVKKIIYKKAFSLIELSIVTVIIGLLVTAIIGGSVLIGNSRLSAARAITFSSQIVSIPGMVLWFENSSKDSFNPGQSSNNAQVTTWFNLEPSNFLTKNNLTAAASNNVIYKEKSINNLPAISMNVAGNLALPSFSSTALSRSTVVIVFTPTATVSSTALTLIDSGSSGSTSSIAIKNNMVALNAGSLAQTSTSTNAASFTQNGQYILMVYFNGSSSKAFVNNITEVGGSGATLSPGSSALNGITVGADRSGANGIAADIAEVIVYNRPLKDSERADVFTYLNKKYQIPVSGI